jgi:hypothetical protein
VTNSNTSSRLYVALPLLAFFADFVSQSAMEALRIEERYSNDTADRAFSLEALSSRNIVEGTRLLAERININKSHARELFVAGKEVPLSLSLSLSHLAL